MSRQKKVDSSSVRILVTGGCGFIGSNFLNAIVPRYPQIHFGNLDGLTYAGNPANLTGIEARHNYTFFQADLRSQIETRAVVTDFRPDRVFHLAAETHVDRSIDSPLPFVETNVLGTFHLLDFCRRQWGRDPSKRFIHISTDEVYGSLGESGSFEESTPYAPNSPYSASKAASDHLVRSYFHTYGTATLITNCSNNYGPYQFPEKLIPLMIGQALAGKPMPIYGSGIHVRDWLFVSDHVEALWTVGEAGIAGETYCIGGGCEMSNIEVVRTICRLLTDEIGGDYERLIAFVPDRPGHDKRYAINAEKIRKTLGWSPSVDFAEGLRRTIRWYLKNQPWVTQIQSGEYRTWMQKQYGSKNES